MAVEITDGNFKDVVLDSDKVVLVDFLKHLVWSL